MTANTPALSWASIARSAGIDARWLLGAALMIVVAGAAVGGVGVGLIVAGLVLAVAVGVNLAARFPSAGLALLAVAAPLLLSDIGFGLQLVHALSVLGVGVVAVAVAFRPIPIRIPAAMLVAAIFIAGLTLAAVLSTAPFDSTVALSLYLLGFGVALAAAIAVANDTGALRWVLRGWTIGALIAIVPSLSGATQVDVRFGGALVDGRTTGIFAQPNDFGEFGLYAVFIGFALVLAARGAFDGLLGIAGLIVGLSAVSLSLSRGSWIGLILGLAALAILLPRVGVWILAAAAAVGAGLVVAASAGLPFATSLLSRGVSVTDGGANPEDHRDLIWGAAIHMWQGSPWTGVGIGRYQDVSATAGFGLGPAGAYHAHNAFLQFGAETGLLALLPLLAMAGTLAVSVVLLVLRGRSAARSSANTANRPGRRRLSACVALFAGLVAIVGHSLVDFVYTNPMLLILAWLMFGLTAGLTLLPAGGDAESARNSRAQQDLAPQPQLVELSSGSARTS